MRQLPNDSAIKGKKQTRFTSNISFSLFPKKLFLIMLNAILQVLIDTIYKSNRKFFDMSIMSTERVKVVLDTNAFYDFCHVLGLQNFGIEAGINQRVDYIAFKAKIEDALHNKSLFIPATTVFEFVCKLRNNEEGLKKVMRLI